MIEIVNVSELSFQTALELIRRRFDALEQASEAGGDVLSPIAIVRRIVKGVRERGDAALLEFTRQYDGCTLTAETLRVTEEEIEQAYELVTVELIEAIRTVIANVTEYQQHILLAAPDDFTRDGVTIQTRYEPLEAVGVYVPGGLAAYPSTLVMAAVPARIAGVERIAVTTPPDTDGAVPAPTLVAAKEAGVTELYRVGGAQAIAALAHGTPTIPRVDKIVGPGNLYVMLAKKEIFGHADIDLFAGPSEILILADATANESYIAADMLSQAEHDPLASSILLTTSQQLAEADGKEIEQQLETLATRDVATQSIDRYGLIVVADTIEQCIGLCNDLAPEHVEVMTTQPNETVAKIRRAGAIFIGTHTPEVVGDYIAGTSHILPTGGSARFFSGLSVNSFLRKTAVIEYSASGLREALPHLRALGNAEGFAAHVASANVRFPKPDENNAKSQK